jgi:hypothetical protein
MEKDNGKLRKISQHESVEILSHTLRPTTGKA